MDCHISFKNYYNLINPCYHHLLLDDTTRYMMLLGGRGSGKSQFICQKIIYEVLANKVKYLIVRKTHKTIRLSVFDMIKKLVYEYKLSPVFEFLENEIRVGNGSRIYSAGLDDPHKLRSINDITSVFIEELSECSEDDFTAVDFILRGKDKHQIMMASNPLAPSCWINKKFFSSPDDNLKKTLITTWRDNCYLDDAYKNNLQKLKEENYELWLRWSEGRFSQLEGLIYTYDLIADEPIEPDCYGLDVGFNDISALIGIKKEGNCIKIREYIYRNKIITKDIVDIMNELKVSKSKYIYVDASRPDCVDEIKRSGYNACSCKKGKNSIIDGINFVKKFQLKSMKSNFGINKEFDSYCWKKNLLGKEIDEPVDLDNHALDALRYAIYTHYYRPQLVTLDRNILGV